MFLVLHIIKNIKTTKNSKNIASGILCFLPLLFNLSFLQFTVNNICKPIPHSSPIQNNAATTYAEAVNPELRSRAGINNMLADDKKNDTADI
ncbi:MAG: hypothetical protein II388_09765 [Clostridia bacterium]|nr:hypothetical protein [Clostridia bacterium]